MEIGLSLVLLIGGGLLARNLVAIKDVDPGFDPDSRLTFRFQVSGPEHPPERRTTFVRTMLFNVSSTDGLTYVLMSGGLALIALVAYLVPAHRATRVDPMDALRME